MKKFLLRTLAFIVLVTIIMVAFDLYLSNKLRQRQVGNYACWNDIFHGRINADIIIMGSSRAWVHYDPAILDSILHTNSYNLGMNGSFFNRQYTRYLLYRKYNPRPRIIIQNIDITTLGFTSGYAQYQYFPYFNDADVRHTIIPYEQFTLADRILPFFRYANYGIRNLFFNKSISVKGYCGQDKSWDVDPIERGNWTDYAADSRTMAMFEEFLAQATAEDIQVIFVHAPIYSELIKYQNGLDEMWNTYRQLAAKYHIPILNYQNDPICSDTNYFYNRTHLNRKGAVLFSRQLANDLKKGNLLN